MRQRSGISQFDASPANSLREPILKKKKITKKVCVMAQGVVLEFKPQYHRK
jgi:hypothetical protein